jgi:acetyl esterase/lipase
MTRHARRRTRRGLATCLFALGSLLLTTACAPLSTLGAVTPSGAARVDRGVAYGGEPAPHLRRQLDVYTPKGTPPVNGWPMVVFFYGGTWRDGQRSDYAFVGQSLARKGVLTLVADYRLYPEVQFPDFLQDTAAAVAWGLRSASPLGADKTRVFIMGHSSGAYNAAMVALDPQWLKGQGHSTQEIAGWIGLAGPYDFLPIENPNAQPVFFHPRYPPGTQPIDFVQSTSPAAFVAAAARDELVNPQRNTQQMATRLSDVAVPVVVHFYSGVGHVSLVLALATPLQWLAPVLDDVVAFVNGKR